MTKKKIKEKEIVLIRTPRGNKYGCFLSLPKVFSGREIELRIKVPLTEEDKLDIQRSELSYKLRMLREKRIKIKERK